jgi:hypothetical protein
MISYPQVSVLESCMHHSSPPYVPQAPHLFKRVLLLFGDVLPYGVYLTKYLEIYLQLNKRCYLWIKSNLYLKEQKKFLRYTSPKEHP